jgi:sulfite reductase (NADPH) hemoprotein beta-component
VTIPLKTATRAPGDLSSSQMHALADLADEFSQAEIRVSHIQNLILPQVNKAQLYALWKQLDKHELAVPNNGSLTDIIACPGLDFCSLANTTTLDITRQINQRFNDLDELYDLGPIRLNISGCMNSCAHHHVADIGVLGVDKKGEQWYQITLGGQPGIQTVLGKRIGPAIDKANVVDALEQILQVYTQRRKADESFINCVNRIGIQPFKESVYERH